MVVASFVKQGLTCCSIIGSKANNSVSQLGIPNEQACHKCIQLQKVNGWLSFLKQGLRPRAEHPMAYVWEKIPQLRLTFPGASANNSSACS